MYFQLANNSTISEFRFDKGSQGDGQDGQDRPISKVYDPVYNPNYKFKRKTKNTARKLDKSKMSIFQIMSKDATRRREIGENTKIFISIPWKHNDDHTKSKEMERNWKYCWRYENFIFEETEIWLFGFYEQQNMGSRD